MGNMPEWLERKRNGGELSPVEISEMIDRYDRGDIPDYQMSAFLMAGYFRGLTNTELTALTTAMWESGITIPRTDQMDYWIDKHSTGGIGDKTSLVLVPLVAATAERLLGKGSVKVPMVSGRGLGHTGGTLDKLEAVPGFHSRIPLSRAKELLTQNGFVMMGQSDEIAPADQKLYALRDVTATVDFIPFITSSILSKKLAENLNGVVFDVKFGNGALFSDYDSAKKLAQLLVGTARSHSMDAVAVTSRMDEPLGRMVGNLLETMEAEDFLLSEKSDTGLAEVTLHLASWMIHLASKRKISIGSAHEECERTLKSKVAASYFLRMLEAQGGDIAAYRARRESFREQILTHPVRALSDGFVSSCDARKIGTLLIQLGGGRLRKEDTIDPLVGFEIMKKLGDKAVKGETILTVYYRKNFTIEKMLPDLQLLYTLSGEAQRIRPWIYEEITNDPS